MNDSAREHVDWLEQLYGQTALVEGDKLEATGTVSGVKDAGLIVTCDQECWPAGETRNVTVSIFAPDALYRLTGPAVADGTEVSCDPGVSLDRIQRRKWPRRRLDLAVTLCPVEDGTHLEGVPGRTVDVSVGGVCVETLRPVGGEGDPMVILRLPGGATIVSGASTVAVEELDDGWRYRLAFRDLEAADAARLESLTAV